MRLQKHSRPLVILLAGVVVIITSMVVANATQTITTPNAVNIPYNLAPVGSSAAITPASSKPVLVMGCCTTLDQSGASQVNLLHMPSVDIEWFGLEPQSPATVTLGNSSTAGTHIVYLSNSHLVELQVASADTIKIHNKSASLTLVGSVTLVW
jgi:hypothetical protein